MVVKVSREGEGGDLTFVDLSVTVGAMPDDVLAGQYAMLTFEQFGMELGDGGERGPAMIFRMVPAGPAADAGLRAGDAIIKVEGREAKSFEEVMISLKDAGLFRGTRVDLTVRRENEDGTSEEKEVRLRKAR